MKIPVAITILSCLAFLPSCNSRPDPNLAQIEANAAAKTLPTPTPAPSIVTSEQVMTAFKNAGLPIINEAVYTEESDPNSLLGRPGQYVGKVNFLDRRIEKKARDKKGCTVEVFRSAEEMEPRKTYLEAVVGSASGSPGKQYIYAHKNALVRLEYALLPKDAAGYESVLRSL